MLCVFGYRLLVSCVNVWFVVGVFDVSIVLNSGLLVLSVLIVFVIVCLLGVVVIDENGVLFGVSDISICVGLYVSVGVRNVYVEFIVLNCFCMFVLVFMMV